MFRVIYEDNHLIAIEKEAGMLTQGDSSGAPSALSMVKEYLKDRYSKPGNVFLGMVQRLDRPVSGILLFARTSKAARRLNEQFSQHTVVKIYSAIVENQSDIPENCWIDLNQHIIRRRGFSEIVSSDNVKSKDARLRVYKLHENRGFSFILVNLLTGKKHQIRAQLSSIQIPVVGDTLYGSKTVMTDDTICLHATALSFTHPVSKERVFLRSEIPARFYNYIKTEPSLISEIQRIIIEAADSDKTCLELNNNFVDER